jgi:hypothetical protein
MFFFVISESLNAVVGQTNRTSSAGAESSLSSGSLIVSNASSTASAAYRLPTPSDFQRLQYYYAASPKNPGPGSEHAIFTLKPDRTWSGDWNSKVVPKPTRKDLEAITPQQVDLFRQAGAFAAGGWQIATTETNIALSTLSVTADSYPLLRAIIERDQALRKYQSLDQKVQTLKSASSSAAAPATR